MSRLPKAEESGRKKKISYLEPEQMDDPDGSSVRQSLLAQTHGTRKQLVMDDSPFIEKTTSEKSEGTKNKESENNGPDQTQEDPEDEEEDFGEYESRENEWKEFVAGLREQLKAEKRKNLTLETKLREELGTYFQKKMEANVERHRKAIEAERLNSDRTMDIRLAILQAATTGTPLPRKHGDLDDSAASEDGVNATTPNREVSMVEEGSPVMEAKEASAALVKLSEDLKGAEEKIDILIRENESLKKELDAASVRKSFSGTPQPSPGFNASQQFPFSVQVGEILSDDDVMDRSTEDEVPMLKMKIEELENSLKGYEETMVEAGETFKAHESEKKTWEERFIKMQAEHQIAMEIVTKQLQSEKEYVERLRNELRQMTVAKEEVEEQLKETIQRSKKQIPDIRIDRPSEPTVTQATEEEAVLPLDSTRVDGELPLSRNLILAYSPIDETREVPPEATNSTTASYHSTMMELGPIPNVSREMIPITEEATQRNAATVSQAPPQYKKRTKPRRFSTLVKKNKAFQLRANASPKLQHNHDTGSMHSAIVPRHFRAQQTSQTSPFSRMPVRARVKNAGQSAATKAAVKIKRRSGIGALPLSRNGVKKTNNDMGCAERSGLVRGKPRKLGVSFAEDSFLIKEKLIATEEQLVQSKQLLQASEQRGNDLKTLENDYKELERKLMKSEGEAESYRQKAERLQEQITSHSEYAELKAGEIADLVKQIEELETEKERFKKIMASAGSGTSPGEDDGLKFIEMESKIFELEKSSDLMKQEKETAIGSLAAETAAKEAAEARCKDLEAKLEERDGKSEQELLTLQQEIKDVTTEKEELSQKIAESRAKLLELEQEMSRRTNEAERKLSEKETALRTSEEDKGKVEKQLRTLKECLHQFDGEKEEYEKKIAGLKAEIANASTVSETEFRSLADEVKGLKENLSKSEKELAESRMKVAETLQNATVTARKLEESELEVRKRDAEIGSLNEKIAALQVENEQFRSRIELSEQKCMDLQKNIAASEAKREEYGSLAKELEQERERVKTMMGQKSEGMLALNEAKTEVVELKKKLLGVQAELENAVAQVKSEKELREAVGGKEARIAQLEAESRKQAALVEKYKAGIVEMEGVQQQFERVVAGKNVEVSALQKRISEIQVNITSLQKELESSRVERNNLQAVLAQKAKEEQRVAASIGSLQAENNRLVQQATQMLAEDRRKQQMILDLKQDVQRSQAQMAAVQQSSIQNQLAQQRVAQLEDEKKDLEQRLAAAQADAKRSSSSSRQDKAQEEAIKELARKLEERTKDSAENEKGIRDLERRYQEVLRENSEKDSEIDRLRKLHREGNMPSSRSSDGADGPHEEVEVTPLRRNTPAGGNASGRGKKKSSQSANNSAISNTSPGNSRSTKSSKVSKGSSVESSPEPKTPPKASRKSSSRKQRFIPVPAYTPVPEEPSTPANIIPEMESSSGLYSASGRPMRKAAATGRDKMLAFTTYMGKDPVVRSTPTLIKAAFESIITGTPLSESEAEPMEEDEEVEEAEEALEVAPKKKPRRKLTQSRKGSQKLEFTPPALDKRVSMADPLKVIEEKLAAAGNASTRSSRKKK